MKAILTILITLLLLPALLPAQMVIQSGATLKTTGNAVITLQDVSLVNNGTLNQQPGDGQFVFTGTQNNTLAGTSVTQFDSLRIAKTGAGQIALQRDINVASGIIFSSGNIDMVDKNILLQPTAMLVGESTASRITSTSTGYVTLTQTLNAPVMANPGNLGVILTSTQNLGSTTIRRGHKAQMNGGGAGSSINRYYDIMPANNAAAGAALRLTYFDAELNGLPETDLNLYKSSNNSNWTSEGYTTRDAVANYVEKTGIAGFSSWTLSTLNNPLPLLFTGFQSGCAGGHVALDWITEQESNVSHFEVQRSEDAVKWKPVAVVPFVSSKHRYSYTDAVNKGFYRIAVVDADGSRVYSDVVQAVCAPGGSMVSVWPNPAVDQVFLALRTTTSSEMNIVVYDGKGALVLQQKEQLVSGANKITLDLSGLAIGAYWIRMVWNNGTEQQSIKVVKQ